MQYNPAAIRELIAAALDSEDLDALCHDRFPEVKAKFTTGQTMTARIQMLLEHAERHGLFEQLLDEIQKKNPHQYTLHEARLKTAPTPTDQKLKTKNQKPTPYLHRLPVTGDIFIGREAELALLDECLADRTVRATELVAWGGVGKSALVNEWLGRQAKTGYGGARRV